MNRLTELLESLVEHAASIVHELKEHNRSMSTIAEDLATLAANVDDLETDDTSLRAQVATLTTENEALKAQIATIDPNAQAELAAAQTQIQALTARIQALLNPPPPAPEFFTFSGDPTTVDATSWPKADVGTDTGATLYTWAGTGPAPVSAEWVLYTGTTAPAPVAVPSAVPSALAITPGQTLAGGAGLGLNGAVTATGGTGPYTFTETGLPPGLTMDASGAITGTAGSAGSAIVTVTVTDSTGATATGELAITIS